MLFDPLEQRPVIDRHLHKTINHLSAFSFINIFAWQDFFRFDLRLIQDALCVFAHSPIGCFLYLPPLGDHISSETFEECFSIMEDINGGRGIGRIENIDTKRYSLFPNQEFRLVPKEYEYLYYKKDIISLKGNRYKSKRSSYNQFVRNTQVDYRPYEPGMASECVRLYRDWADSRRKTYTNDVYCQMLFENEKVHGRLLKYYASLGLVGRVVRVGGVIKGYTLGYPVSENVFCVLAEIADLNLAGIAVYMFREFCRDADLGQYQFINVMDGFCMDNIRQTKLSFHPTVLMRSYVAVKV